MNYSFAHADLLGSNPPVQLKIMVHSNFQKTAPTENAAQPSEGETIQRVGGVYADVELTTPK